MLLKELFSQNKKSKLVFKTTNLNENQIYSYFKEKYRLYNSEKFPQRMVSSTRKILENDQSNSDIKNFIDRLKKLGLSPETNIEIGDYLSVMDFEINFAWKEITVRGFTNPQKIVKISKNKDDTINYIQFENGDRFPKLTPAVYKGKPVDYAVYFNSANEAEKAFSMLALSVPKDWDIYADDIKKENIAEAIKRTGKGDTAVIGWGRGMGHKGHMMLASSVITKANEVGGDPYFVVSRTVGKDDPITPDEKLAIYKKVFPQQGHIFQAASDEIPDLTRVLSNINQQGYKNVIVVVGSDQVAAFQYLKKYNGVPDKKGNVAFNFDNLDVISRQETGDPSAGEEGPRATPMRNILMDPSASDEQKFQVWRDAMSPQISDDEVRDLMNKAEQRMKASGKLK